MFLEQIWSQGRMQSAVTRAHLSVYFLLTVAVCSGSVCVWGGGDPADSQLLNEDTYDGS